MKRRNFIKLGAAGSVALQFKDIFSMYENMAPEHLPRRSLGKTNEMLSIVGFGGIALRNKGQDFANMLVPKAFNAGINYFDIAPAYGDSLELLDPHSGITGRRFSWPVKQGKETGQVQKKELNESLKLLKTDHFDLYQFHAMSKMEDVETVFGPDGAMETFLKAKQEGKIRFIGFSAHNEEVALKMMELYDFDTVLYPINCVCWENGNFGPQVFKIAKSKDMGVLALKAVASHRVPSEERPYPNMWYHPFEKEDEITKSLQYTLSKDITATVHAGDSIYMKKTLDFIRENKTIEAPSEEMISKMIEGIDPIFSHPATSA